MLRKTVDLLLAALFCGFVAVNFASAVGTLGGNASDGLKLAKEVCETCHVVDKGVRVTSKEGAPAFQVVADDLQVTAMSLRVYLQTADKKMPNLILSKTETDDVISYIISLK